MCQAIQHVGVRGVKEESFVVFHRGVCVHLRTYIYIHFSAHYKVRYDCIAEHYCVIHFIKYKHNIHHISDIKIIDNTCSSHIQ